MRPQIVLGLVKRVSRHPQADKLQVCEVQVGPDLVKQIVCGAPNAKAAEGRYVAVAQVGAKWNVAGSLDKVEAKSIGAGETIKIKKSKIRGQVSEGMICALGELGLIHKAEGSKLDLESGIWIAPEDLLRDAKLGEELPKEWLDRLGLQLWEDSRREFEGVAAKWKEIDLLSEISMLLEWDHQCMMPGSGASARAAQKAHVAKLHHDACGNKSYEASLLAANKNTTAALNFFERRSLELATKELKKTQAVDEKTVMELELARAKCFELWQKARERSNYSIVQSSLQSLIDVSREMANAQKDALYGPDSTVSPYQALLESHVLGLDVARVETIFNTFSKRLSEFAKSVQHPSEGTQSVLEAKQGQTKFPKQASIDLSTRVVKQIFGPDLDKMVRLDESAHPFSIRISSGDARITTRYSTEDLRTSLMGSVHEAGHALYELQLPKESHFPAGKCLDIACHESQSLFWERMIAQSQAFAEWIGPQIWQSFHYGKYDQSIHGQFNQLVYKSVNQLSKTPIRVESDELHYPLHVKVRFDLEKQLIEGQLNAKDLGEAWKTAYSETLGINPEDDNVGVLQDIHWYVGYYGYFPSYSIGAIVAQQLHMKARESVEGFDSLVAKGEFGPIRQWLSEQVHAYGRLDNSVDGLCKRVTGRGLDVDGYCDYLLAKYAIRGKE